MNPVTGSTAAPKGTSAHRSALRWGEVRRRPGHGPGVVPAYLDRAGAAPPLTAPSPVAPLPRRATAATTYEAKFWFPANTSDAALTVPPFPSPRLDHEEPR